MENLIYKTEIFEGPLDLLLSLISKNKMRIEDIEISVICDQYMEYINTMQNLDIDLSSEFIVMASELMYIKSKILLPKINDDEEDPREELAKALIEYQRAKQASSQLSNMYAQYSGRMEKDTDEISTDRTYVAEHDLKLLQIAMNRVLSNIEISDEAASKNIMPLISTRTISVGEKVYSILRILLTSNGYVNVIYCFNGIISKNEAVATFMAILEMLRWGRISLQENENSEFDGVVQLENEVFIRLNEGEIRKKTGAEENNE